MVDVFISYPRSDRAKIELIKAKLDALGLQTFFDIEGIDGGATFPDVIDQALREAKVVLGCWSSHAFQSRWCMIECRRAASRGVLVPVAIEKFGELDMPADFGAINYLDLTDFVGVEPHEGWTRTLRALSRHLGRRLGEDRRGEPFARSVASSETPAVVSGGKVRPRRGLLIAGVGTAALAAIGAVLWPVAWPARGGGRDGLNGGDESLPLPDGFYLVLEPGSNPEGESVIVPDLAANGPPLTLIRDPLLSARRISHANSGVDQYSAASVSIDLTASGSLAMRAATAANVGRRMAIVVNGAAVSVARINEPIEGGKLQITGGLSAAQARAIASRLTLQSDGK